MYTYYCNSIENISCQRYLPEWANLLSYVYRSLLRYDFNEPCKGKDQCDRESAAAKTVIRSFLDAGNNVVSAKDIYDGMHYGKGLQDVKVCVAEIDALNTTLNTTKINNFTK